MRSARFARTEVCGRLDMELLIITEFFTDILNPIYSEFTLCSEVHHLWLRHIQIYGPYSTFSICIVKYPDTVKNMV